MIIGYSRKFNSAASPPSTNLQFWIAADLVVGLSDDTAISGTTGNGIANMATGGSYPNEMWYGNGAAVSAPKYRTSSYNGLTGKFEFTDLSAQRELFLAAASNSATDTTLSGWTAATGYVVSKNTSDPPAATPSGFWKFGDESGNQVSHHPYADGNIYESWGTTSRKTVGNPTPALTNLNLYSVTTASGSYRVHLNASEIFSTGTNTCTFGIANGHMSFGRAWMFSSYYFVGDMVEYLIYNVAHDDTTRGTVESYLKTKWGIA